MCFWRSSSKSAERIITAVGKGDFAEVQRLVQANRRLVNASWPFLSNRFPLSEALLCGYEDIALYLIENGASLTKGSNQYGTLLHFSAGKGLVKATELLLARHLDVNAKNVDEETPLHHAASGGHIEVAMLLIGHGADVSAKDNYGKTPLQVAREKHNEAVIKLLESETS